MEFVDWKGLEKHLTDVCDRYEQSAPTVADWANDLYVRLRTHADKVTVSEVMVVSALKVDEVWEQPNYAANRIYKLMNRLGRDTTGMAGF